MSYASLINFGNTKASDPLTYCAVSGYESGFNNTLGNTFLHPESKQCQIYMSQYCAKNWDGVCEKIYNDTTKIYPSATNTKFLNDTTKTPKEVFLTRGQNLLRNTALEKYIKMMSSNCVLKQELFDPTVPNSPMISRWVSTNSSYTCMPIYDVVASTIDNDIVMNKILLQPYIAIDLLSNIYNTRVREGTLGELENTRIGDFYKSAYFSLNMK